MAPLLPTVIHYGILCSSFVALWNFMFQFHCFMENWFCLILFSTHERFQDVDASATHTRGPGRPRVRREPSNVSLPSPSPASQSDAPLLPTVHHYGFFIIMEFFALVSLLYGIFCSSFIALWKICNLFHIIPPPSVRYLDTSSVICMMLFLEFLLPSAVVVVRADQPLQIGVLFRW